MRKNLLHASLLNKREISIVFLSSTSFVDDVHFYLSVNGNKIPLQKEVSRRQSVPEVKLVSDVDIVLGQNYKIVTSEEEEIFIDFDEYTTTKEFDELYSYNGDDLGATYSRESTTFKLWSPLSDRVYLKLEKEENSFLLYEMKREDKGVYSITIKRDLFNKKYSFMVRVAGYETEIRDPYEKSTSFNSKYSAIIDLDFVKSIGKIPLKTPLKRYTDAIIYEVNIRDFTEGLDIDNPGTYLAFLEKLDYLKRLGVTHVQLQPILDFANVDDMLKDTYNWGYDPISFFALEGSYSYMPEDPLSRIIEFKTLVNELHKADIRVVVDVVYNHVHDYGTSGLQKNVPYYYFRRQNNKMCNGSGCGNDVASERTMVRKLIVDSTKYLVDVFDIDGFRFDLMGLTDIKTMQEVYDEVKALKPDAMLYGEGWHMNTALPDSDKSSMVNADKLPGFAFFNDTFRDLIKGPTFSEKEKGYISGNIDYKVPVEHVLLGSVLSHKFKYIHQSLNYLECHDNQTLFDKLMAIHEDKEDVLRRMRFGNTLTVLSLGIPFIHMGQEIGLTKFGLDNTYNKKNVNTMDWKLVEERKDMINHLIDIIKIRKNFNLFTIDESDNLSDIFDFFQLPNGILTIAVRDPKYLRGHKKALAIINPTNETIPVELDEYFTVFLSSNGLMKKETILKNYLAPPGSFDILYHD